MLHETTVVNIRTSKYDVLIDRTTIFGNPFHQSRYGREECIRHFEAYFYERIERDPEWKSEVMALRGRVLGCHCVPLDCHGHIYADYLNAYTDLERARLTPILETALSRINTLATEHGWYDPELQGEAFAAIEGLGTTVFDDFLASSRMVGGSEDAIGVIMDYLGRSK